MNNWKNLDSQEMRIRESIDRALKTKYDNGLDVKEDHLDDDTLSVFVEGNLSEKESKPIIRHLVACSFCRNITAELVRLDFAFTETDIEVTADTKKPAKISDVLSNVLSKIFGGDTEAVFAHQENDDQTLESSTDKTEDLKEKI